MAGGGGNLESGEPEFQIAPMIDVLLVLLIFFVSISTMDILRVDQDIKLPVAADAKKAEKERGEIIVNLRWNEKLKKVSYGLDQNNYEKLDDLKPQMEIAVKAATQTALQKKFSNKNVRLVIRADRATPSFEVSRVMNAGAEAGISDIAFSAASRED